MMNKIHIGDRYEVKPKNFHRAIVGKAMDVIGDKIFFEMESCDLVDRERADATQWIEAEVHDVKRQLSSQCFFS